MKTWKEGRSAWAAAGAAIAIYLNSLSGRETAAGPKLWSGGGDVYVRFK